MQRKKHGQSGKANKGLIIGLSVGGAVLFLVIILIVVIVIVLNSGGASKADYNQAIVFKNNANKAQGKVVSSYVTPFQEKAVANTNLATIKENNEVFQKSYTGLENSKAVKMDSKLAEQFEAVKNKKVKFDAYVVTVNEFGNTIYPIAAAVREKLSSADNENNSGEWKEFAAKLQAIQGQLKSDVNKQYVQKLISDLNDIASVADKVSAGEKDFSNYDSVAVSKYRNANLALQKDNSEYSAKITELQSESQLTSELRGVGSYLSTK